MKRTLKIITIFFYMFITFACIDSNQSAIAVQPKSQTLPTEPQGEISLVRNIYIIFDGSGSMNEKLGGECRGDQKFKSKIDGAKWALTEFLKFVSDDVHLGMFVFDSHGDNERVPLGSVDREQFSTAIQQISANGGTPLADSIRFGVSQLVKQREQQLGYGGYRLLVITDGEAGGISEATAFATKQEIPIYAIGLCIGTNHPLRQVAVDYKAADSSSALAEGMKEALAESNYFDATTFEN